MGYFALGVTITVCILIMGFVLKKPIFAVPIGRKGKKLRIESFWVVALLAPLILLISTAISPKEIFLGLVQDTSVNPLKILALFLSMCFMSVMLDRAGFFEYLAVRIMGKAKKSQMRLFIVFFALVSVLTIFTSNDVIILTFTPFIYYFSKNAKINPTPYIVAEFIAANTWSLMLVIGNPTNIYIATSAQISFFDYLQVMALPTIAAGLISFFMLWLMFRKMLKQPIIGELITDARLKDKTISIISLVTLSLSIVMLAVASYIGLEMWIVSLAFAFFLLLTVSIISLYRNKRDKKRIVNNEQNEQAENYAKLSSALKGLPYSVIPFLLSLFVAILTLEKHGITAQLARLMNVNNQLSTSLLFGFSSALSANILNNIPMSVLFSSILQSSAGSANYLVAVYASIIGSNIGAFFSPVGALAGIMFLRILKEKGSEFTVKSFLKYCAPIAIVSLLTALITLALIL